MIVLLLPFWWNKVDIYNELYWNLEPSVVHTRAH